MYDKQEHYLPITIWYLQHVGNHAIMPKNRRPGSRHQFSERPCRCFGKSNGRTEYFICQSASPYAKKQNHYRNYSDQRWFRIFAGT